MRILRMVGICLMVFILVSTATPLWNLLGDSLSLEPQIAAADAIVVLGGGIDGLMMSESSLRRFVYGMELYKRGLAPLLVLSGPADNDTPDRPEAEVRREIALR